MASSNPNSSKWYICRYRSLTKSLMKKCEMPPRNLQISLLCCPKIVRYGKTTKLISAPILPGYIFVKGHHDNILRDDVLGHLQILKKREDNSFLIVSPQQMHSIFRFAEEFKEMQQLLVNAYDRLEMETLHLETEAEVSPEVNDYVEIIEGPFEGMRGYLKMRERSKQGTFFFYSKTPVSTSIYQIEHMESDDSEVVNMKSSSLDACAKAQMNVLPCFEVTRGQIKILQFGTSNGHASDFIGKAYKKALEELKKSINAPLSTSARRNISGYVIRYTDVETWSIKQKANLYRLLLTCHAALGNHENFKRTLSQIEGSIYPDFEFFADHKRQNKDRVAARKAFENFKGTIKYITHLHKIVDNQS